MEVAGEDRDDDGEFAWACTGLEGEDGRSREQVHLLNPPLCSMLMISRSRYFDHLSAKTAMERTNLFIQADPYLFSDAPEISTGHEKRTIPKDLQVRRERQTFTRLEKTGAVLFTVRTYMQPLEDLEDEEAVALIHQVRGWEEEIRVYKGWDVWGGAFEEWCEKRFGR